MDHPSTVHENNLRRSDADGIDYPEYPVLRLARPLDDHQYQNDNDNNMYYRHDNDNSSFESRSSLRSTESATSTPRNTSFTNLTGTVTNSHPLMCHSPTSPIPSDFHDSPDKKSPKNVHKHYRGASKNPNAGAKYSFKTEAHGSHINVHKAKAPARKHQYVSSADQNYSLDKILHSELPSLEQYVEKISEFPESPSMIRKSLVYDLPREVSATPQPGENSDPENDKSMYEATLSPNLQNVSLTLNEKVKLRKLEERAHQRRRLIRVAPSDFVDFDSDELSSVESVSESLKSDGVYVNADSKLDSQIIQELLESSEEIEDSVFESLSLERPDDAVEARKTAEPDPQKSAPEPIEEYSAVDERRDSRHWQKIVLPSGEHRSIDMRVIEPYKRVLSHGGYLKAGGHNAIVVFSACFLPDKSRVDYDYVMDNLFLYVLSTLEQLVTEDYVLVYLHGGAGRGRIPTLSWLKRCYQLVDRRLRKNLKKLYLVHPTFWLKTLVYMCKPFISSKFYRKINFMTSLADLTEILPIEQASIPDKVKNYEKIKFSC